jgi:hypothetical protein
MVLADRATTPEVVAGGAGRFAEVADWDGVMATHRDILGCLRAGRPALTSLDDALETMRLVDWIERGARRLMHDGDLERMVCDT